MTVIAETLQDRINEDNAKRKAFFDEAFTCPTTGKPYNIPADLRRVAERICSSYGINGICDPMYIANVVAKETGRGDGQSNFTPQEEASK